MQPTKAGNCPSNIQQMQMRLPTPGDGLAVYRLIKNSPPLDVNSPYFYLIQTKDFASTCALAEVEGEVLGWVSGYIRPDKPTTYFLWQVALDSRARGLGLASQLIAHLLQRSNFQQITHLETSITPSNQASWALFTRLAQQLACPLNKSILFTAEQLGGDEDEELVRIGPFSVHPDKQ